MAVFCLLIKHQGVQRDTASEKIGRRQAHLLLLHHLELRVHGRTEVLCTCLRSSEAIEIVSATEAALKGLVGALATSESSIHFDINIKSRPQIIPFQKNICKN